MSCSGPSGDGDGHKSIAAAVIAATTASAAVPPTSHCPLPRRLRRACASWPRESTRPRFLRLRTAGVIGVLRSSVARPCSRTDGGGDGHRVTFDHETERSDACDDIGFERDVWDSISRDPYAVLALEVDEEVATALKTDLGVVPRHALYVILENEIVLLAAADPDGESNQLDLDDPASHREAPLAGPLHAPSL